MLAYNTEGELIGSNYVITKQPTSGTRGVSSLISNKDRETSLCQLATYCAITVTVVAVLAKYAC